MNKDIKNKKKRKIKAKMLLRDFIIPKLTSKDTRVCFGYWPEFYYSVGLTTYCSIDDNPHAYDPSTMSIISNPFSKGLVNEARILADKFGLKAKTVFRDDGQTEFIFSLKEV